MKPGLKRTQGVATASTLRFRRCREVESLAVFLDTTTATPVLEAGPLETEKCADMARLPADTKPNDALARRFGRGTIATQKIQRGSHGPCGDGEGVRFYPLGSPNEHGTRGWWRASSFLADRFALAWFLWSVGVLMLRSRANALSTG